MEIRSWPGNWDLHDPEQRQCLISAEVEDREHYQQVECWLTRGHDDVTHEAWLVRQGNFFANRVVRWEDGQPPKLLVGVE